MAKFVLDGIEREVLIERGANGTTVSVDGRRYDVSDVIALEGAVAFFANGASRTAYVSTGSTGTRISIGGGIFLLTDAQMDADRPAAAGGGQHDGRVEAPMPGGIIALHVKAGDAVKTGDPLVVLESMKMHNEITAPIDGVVKRLNCKVGEQVSFGHVLAEIGAG